MKYKTVTVRVVGVDLWWDARSYFETICPGYISLVDLGKNRYRIIYLLDC